MTDVAPRQDLRPHKFKAGCPPAATAGLDLQWARPLPHRTRGVVRPRPAGGGGASKRTRGGVPLVRRAPSITGQQGDRYCECPKSLAKNTKPCQLQAHTQTPTRRTREHKGRVGSDMRASWELLIGGTEMECDRLKVNIASPK